MKTSARMIKVMHHFESCRLQAYPDPGSADGHPWTIGWGATGPGIHKGVTWTQEQADERYRQDLEKFEGVVEDALSARAVPQCHFDALVSFTYNVGPSALKGSTLLKMYLNGDVAGAANQFLRWNKNDGRVMHGLTRRRVAERDVFLNDSTAEAAIAVAERAPRQS